MNWRISYAFVFFFVLLKVFLFVVLVKLCVSFEKIYLKLAGRHVLVLSIMFMVLWLSVCFARLVILLLL